MMAFVSHGDRAHSEREQTGQQQPREKDVRHSPSPIQRIVPGRSTKKHAGVSVKGNSARQTSRRGHILERRRICDEGLQSTCKSRIRQKELRQPNYCIRRQKKPLQAVRVSRSTTSIVLLSRVPGSPGPKLPSPSTTSW